MFACACPAKHYEDSYLEVVRLLIKRGAKVNVKNNQGLTPLKIAQEGKWHKITTALKKGGARS
jgi:ankyrin repeat protein